MELNSFFTKLIAVGFITLLLGLVGLSEGAGYVTISVNHKTLSISPRHVDLGGRYGVPEIGLGHIVFICNVTVSLNPLLYPMSYLIGNGKSSCVCKEAAYPMVVNKKYETMNNAKFGAVFPEFLRNLPYIFVIGFLINFFITKLYLKISSKFDLAGE